jgi:hypothetical protein
MNNNNVKDIQKHVEFLERKILILESENEILKSSYNIYYKLIQINSNLNQIIYFTIIFLKFLNNNKYKKAIIIGNFVQRIFEFVLRFHHIKNNINNIHPNHYIDTLTFIYCNSDIVNKYKITLEFIKTIGKIEKKFLKGEVIQIHNFVLKNIFLVQNINNSSSKIQIPFSSVPYYNLEFYNIFQPDFIIKVIIYCWKDNSNYFTIDNFGLGYTGLVQLNNIKIYLLKYLENMINSQTYFIQTPNTLQNYAFPSISISLEQKQQYLNIMYNMFKNHTLNMIIDGYQICGIKPSIFFETENDCVITGCNKPYPCFILDCGHKLSFMAYKGIINNSDSEYTQSIKCPLCRKNLIIKFENISNIYDINFNIETEENNQYKIENNNNFISNDSYEQM